MKEAITMVIVENSKMDLIDDQQILTINEKQLSDIIVFLSKKFNSQKEDIVILENEKQDLVEEIKELKVSNKVFYRTLSKIYGDEESN